MFSMNYILERSLARYQFDIRSHCHTYYHFMAIQMYLYTHTSVLTTISPNFGGKRFSNQKDNPCKSTLPPPLSSTSAQSHTELPPAIPTLAVHYALCAVSPLPTHTYTEVVEPPLTTTENNG